MAAKYDVVQKVNGNLVINSTWVDNLPGAKAAYGGLMKALYNDPDTTSGVIAILDDNLDVVEGMKHFIEK